MKRLLAWIDLSTALSMLWIVNGLKLEQTVRRGPGSEPHCMSPLISSYEEFPDSGFSASSVLMNKTDFLPYQARLIEVYGSKEHTSGQAWCPNSVVDDMLREWIQAEFSELVLIKSIFTAGRGDGNVREFMPNFVLKYQREDEGAWYEHVKRDGTRVLKANSDPRNLARATLDSVIVARRVRVYPFSRKGSQKVCLRFALYGCKFPDGVVSYSMPQGGDGRSLTGSRDSLFRSTSGDILDSNVVSQLKDLSYDGQIIGTTNQLTDGLGQLMDNVAFLGNLTRESELYPSQPGFHFVGWHQSDRTDVDIVFKFDTVRRFTWLRLFTFDSIPLQVRLFSHAKVSFSLNGGDFGKPLEFSTGRVQLYDSQVAALTRSRRRPENNRSKPSRMSSSALSDLRVYSQPDYGGALVVELPLTERSGSYVRLSLTPTDAWLVLSEVQFNSTVENGVPSRTPSSQSTYSSGNSNRVNPSKSNFVGDRELNSLKPAIKLTQSNGESQAVKSVVNSGSPVRLDYGTNLGKHETQDSSPDTSVTDSEKLAAVLPVIVSSAILLFLGLVVIFVWICYRQHFRRLRLRCQRKVLLIDGGRGSQNVLGHGPGAMTPEELAKLLGSYSTVPFKSHIDTDSVPVSRFPLANGGQPANVIQRLNEVGLSSSKDGVTADQYPPTRPTTGTIRGGVFIPGNGSNGDGVVGLPTTSTNDFVPSSNVSNLYAGTDLSCMSPEYASASIFGFTPPPSEAPSIGPPTCTESMPPVHFRPSLPNQPLQQFSHTVPGSLPVTASIYTGPSSIPLNSSTLHLPPRHPTPNPGHRTPAGMDPTNGGFVFLPQSAFSGICGEDSKGLFPTITPKTYGFFPELGRSDNLYQSDQLVGPNQLRPADTNFADQSPRDPWMSNPATHDTDPRKAVWLANVYNGAIFANGLFPNSVRLAVGSSVSPPGMADFSQSSPNSSPQRSFPAHIVFPSSVLSQLHLTSTTETPVINNNGHRGSPVGAAAGTVTGYPREPNDCTNRDESQTGRLSVYSMCT